MDPRDVPDEVCAADRLATATPAGDTGVSFEDAVAAVREVRGAV